MRICFDMHEAVYRNNETVMEYASSMKKIGLILEGQAVLYCIDEDGNQYMIDNLKKDSVFGEPFLLPEESQHYYVCAKSETRVLFIAYEHVIKRCENACKFHSQLVSNLLQMIALRASQQAPDSPEALAAIPSLTLADLPRENVILPKEEGKAGDLAILAHDIDTSGILYAEILFPLDAVPTELLPLVPLMGRSLTEMGTSKRDFVELGTLLASKTGGMDAAPLVATMRGTRMPVAKLCLGGKATADKADDLFSLMAEVLTDTNFDNPQRFTQMVLEERARLEQSLIPAGHGTVIARLRAAYSLAGQISEAIGGITYLEAIRALSERVVSDWDSVRADLEILRGLILNRQDAILNLTADAGTLAAVQPYAAALGRALPTAFSVPLEREPLRAAANEALIVPAQVNYVGKGCNIYDLGYTWHGSAHVITRHLRMGWLWDQVRVQGGAYGAFCALDRMSGSLALVSYRDPNVEKTLATYDATAD